MPQFLVERGNVSGDGSEALLTGDEAHHLLRVFRAREGEPVDLFDGEGNRWRGRLTSSDRNGARVSALAALPSNEPPVELCLIQAIPKGERWAWLLAKATELGVATVWPVTSCRSVAVAGGRGSEARQSRWAGIAAAAAKQCERGRVPAVEAQVSLPALLARFGEPPPGEVRLVLAERRDGDGLPVVGPPARVVLAVGPEGGWAPEELAAFGRAGFRELSLGPRILRAETAAVAALVLALARWGDVGTPAPAGACP